MLHLVLESRVPQAFQRSCSGIKFGTRRHIVRQLSQNHKKDFGDKWDNLVGFIGCGNMGSKMASNLMKSGQALIIYDSQHERAANLAKESLASRATSSIEELAKICKTVVTMLPNSSNVESVYEVLLPNSRSGSLLIDSSTISPLVSAQLSKKASCLKIDMIDAPVSGGVPAATDATLTFMVGGQKEALQRAMPLLKQMGSRVVHCGPAGSGCSTKLCNNLILAISMAGVAEGMNLGVKLGLDPQILASVLNSSTARCWSSELYNPYPGVMPNVPSSRGYTGGFATNLMEKDLKLALDAAQATQSVSPMGALVHQLYSIMKGQGNGQKDFSAIMELIMGNDLKGEDKGPLKD